MEAVVNSKARKLSKTIPVRPTEKSIFSNISSGAPIQPRNVGTSSPFSQFGYDTLVPIKDPSCGPSDETNEAVVVKVPPLL